MRALAVGLGFYLAQAASNEVQTGSLPLLAAIGGIAAAAVGIYQARQAKDALRQQSLSKEAEAIKMREETKKIVERASYEAAESLKGLNDIYRAELDAARAEISAERAELAAARAEIARLNAEIELLRQQLASSEGDREQLLARLHDDERRRDELEERVRELETRQQARGE